MVVQRVEARRVRRPFIFTSEFTAVGSNPVLSQLCRVCRRAVHLQDKGRWQNRSAILNKFRQQVFNIKFTIHFGLVWNEMQSSLPTETDTRRNHDVLGELCSLSYQPTFIDVCVKAGGENLLSQLPADVHRRLCESWWWKLQTYAKLNVLCCWSKLLTDTKHCVASLRQQSYLLSNLANRQTDKREQTHLPPPLSDVINVHLCRSSCDKKQATLDQGSADSNLF